MATILLNQEGLVTTMEIYITHIVHIILAVSIAGVALYLLEITANNRDD